MKNTTAYKKCCPNGAPWAPMGPSGPPMGPPWEGMGGDSKTRFRKLDSIQKPRFKNWDGRFKNCFRAIQKPRGAIQKLLWSDSKTQCEAV